MAALTLSSFCVTISHKNHKHSSNFPTTNLNFDSLDNIFFKPLNLRGKRIVIVDAATSFRRAHISAFVAAPLPQLSLRLNLWQLYHDYKLGFCVADKCPKFRAYSVKSNQGTWEDPDDGSGSDYDEEEEEEVQENDLDFESDWEEEKDSPATATSADKLRARYDDEHLVEEVELLLEPEERKILQQNVTADLNRISTDKWQPLQSLALSGQIHFMDMLLEEGVCINNVDKDGLTALHKAVIGKKDAVTSHLLRKGASPHIRDMDGATVLHYAVQVCDIQTVKLLIKYNVDINVEDNEGWTPLHIALQTRNRVLFKILLVNGADKTTRNKDGKTPLDIAFCYGKDFKSYDLAKLLRILPVTDAL